MKTTLMNTGMRSSKSPFGLDGREQRGLMVKWSFILLLLFLIGGLTTASAQKSWVGGNSNWNTAANWSPNGVPAATDAVTIPDNATVSINTAAVCASLTILGGSNTTTVSISPTNSLTVSGNITINGGTGNGDDKIFAVNAGTLTCASIIMADSGHDAADVEFNIGSGTANVSGNISMAGSATRNAFNMSSGTTGRLNIQGTITGAGSIVANGGAINFNGSSAQTVPMNANYTYYTILLNNSSASGATLGGVLPSGRILKDFRVQSGIFNNGGFSITGSGNTDTFEVMNGALFNMSGTSGAPSGFDNFVLGATSTVGYTGPGTQTVRAGVTYGNLILNNGTKSLTNATTVGGLLTVRSITTLSLGNNNLTANGGIEMEAGSSGAASAITATGSGILNLNGNVVVSDLGTGANGASIQRIAVAATRTFTIDDGTSAVDLTINGIISGAGGIVKAGAGTMNLTGINSYTGTTTINTGELRLNPTANVTINTQVVLNGGELSTAGITSGRTITNTNPLKLDANSVINLGSNAHVLRFTNSSGITWAGNTLTINGWTGAGGISGTAGEIFFGTNATALSNAQLAKITFTGYPGTPLLLATGELVPQSTTPLLAITGTLAHGNSCVATPASTITYTITNTGFNPAAGITVVSNNPQFVVSNLSSTSIPGNGGTATYNVTFTPTSSGAKTATITVASTTSGSNSPTNTVTGTGVAQPTATAGGTKTICQNATAVLTAGEATASNGTIVWTHNGFGSLSGTTTLTPTYTPNANDVGNPVTLTLTVSNAPCVAATATYTVNVDPIATVNAGSNQTVCANGMITLAGTIGGSATSSTWSAPSGSFGDASSLTSTYTPGIASGTVVLTLTTNDPAGPCGAVSNTITITVRPTPATTTTSVCLGQSGVLNSSTTCPSFTGLTESESGSGGVSDAITYGGAGNVNIAINFPALPANALVVSTQVTITYTSTLLVSNRNDLRVRATPPPAVGGAQTDLQPSTQASAGTVTNAPLGTWGVGNPAGAWLFEFREITNNTFLSFPATDANISDITINVAYSIQGVIQWYTLSTGGTPIGTGSSFNPVGVPGSGLADTNTPGTTIFYAECSTVPGCRTATNFVVNPLPVVSFTGLDAVYCQNGTGSNLIANHLGGSFSGPGITNTGAGTASFNPALAAGSPAITYTYTDGNTCTNTVTQNIIVHPTPQVTAPAAQFYCAATLTGGILLNGSPSGVTYDITGGSAVGLEDQIGVTSIPAFTTAGVAATATVTITPKANNCTGTPVTYNITVNPTPTVVAPSNQVYCANTLTDTIVLSGTPVGVTFAITGGSAIGLADQSGLTAIPSFTGIAGSATITITPSANNCTGAAVTYEVVVDPATVPGNVASNATICQGETSGLLTLSGYTGTILRWERASAPFTTWTVIANTANSYTSGPLGQTTHFRAVVKSGVCSELASTEAVITVKQVTSGIFSVAAAPACFNTNGIVTLGGLVASKNFDVSYNKNGVPQPTVSIVSDLAGNGDFNVFVTGSGIGVTVTSVLNTSDNCAFTPTVNNSAVFALASGCTQVGAQCGQELTAIDAYVYANIPSPGAQSYIWRVTTLDANGIPIGSLQPQLLGSAIRNIKITQLPVYAFNTSYKVEVSVVRNGVQGPYGQPCTVKTPSATTQLTVCNAFLSALNNTIYATVVPFATGYRFTITEASTGQVATLYRPIRDFKLSLITEFLPKYGEVYRVKVAVRNTDGTYLVDGPECQVTTPDYPVTVIAQSDAVCDAGYQVPAYNTAIYAVSVAGAVKYEFTISGESLMGGIGIQEMSLIKSVRSFTLQEFVNAGAMFVGSGVYSVWVKPVFDAAMTPADLLLVPSGHACTIIVPVSGRNSISKDKFNVVAYPNPFADAFGIDLVTPSEDRVQVKVYDMTGRLLEVQTTVVADMQTLQVGAKYPSGVYNVIVTQGENVKTLRVIKR